MANPNTAKFPTALPVDADIMVATNEASALLTSAIDDTQTTIPVSVVFSTPCIIKIDSEKIFVPSFSGLNYTSCVRAFQSTTAASHIISSQVFGFIEAYHHNQLSVEIQAITAALGINLANVLKTTTAFGGDVSGVASSIVVEQVGGVSKTTIGNISAGYSKIRNQTPTGAINGSNTAFVVSVTPISGSVLVWKNGLLLKTTDYSVSGTTITMGAAPSGSDWLYVLYRSLT